MRHFYKRMEDETLLKQDGGLDTSTRGWRMRHFNKWMEDETLQQDDGG